MFEDFLNAIQNFRRNKTRTFLSLLGVIIGVQVAPQNKKRVTCVAIAVFIASP